MNYLVRGLGTPTAGRAEKARIFEEVFKDVLPVTQFGQLAGLTGANLEVVLNQPGALNFRVEHMFNGQIVTM